MTVTIPSLLVPWSVDCGSASHSISWCSWARDWPRQLLKLSKIVFSALQIHLWSGRSFVPLALRGRTLQA